jgi:hypothetical protein
VCVNKRNQVGFLDEEFLGDMLRRQLLRTDQPPHRTRPNAQLRGHLASSEIQRFSLRPHYAFAYFLLSGSRPVLMG